MPMFQGASGVTISGGDFRDVAGDMNTYDHSSHVTNHNSGNTTTNYDSNNDNSYQDNSYNEYYSAAAYNQRNHQRLYNDNARRGRGRGRGNYAPSQPVPQSQQYTQAGYLPPPQPALQYGGQQHGRLDYQNNADDFDYGGQQTMNQSEAYARNVRQRRFEDIYSDEDSQNPSYQQYQHPQYQRPPLSHPSSDPLPSQSAPSSYYDPGYGIASSPAPMKKHNPFRTDAYASSTSNDGRNPPELPPNFSHHQSEPYIAERSRVDGDESIEPEDADMSNKN